MYIQSIKTAQKPRMQQFFSGSELLERSQANTLERERNTFPPPVHFWLPWPLLRVFRNKCKKWSISKNNFRLKITRSLELPSYPDSHDGLILKKVGGGGTSLPYSLELLWEVLEASFWHYFTMIWEAHPDQKQGNGAPSQKFLQFSFTEQNIHSAAWTQSARTSVTETDS